MIEKMKKYITQIFTILLLTVFSIGSFAQDKRTLDTKVADILAQMPAKDLVHLERIMGEITDLGPEGFQKIANQLVPPGTGDDTAVRFTINSYARYASSFGRERERNFAENQLLAALKTNADKDVKTYLMNELNLVAGEKSIQELKAYLTDEYLTEPAAQTLLSVGGNTAAHAFMEALAGAPEKCKPTLIKALGELKFIGALGQISPFAADKNTALKKTALEALAQIGDAGSYKTLLNAAKNANLCDGPMTIIFFIFFGIYL